MRTVHEVSKLTGVSIRTLHYYDSIGLLCPDDITEAGYRLYDDTALERLQHIMLFKELQFSLKEIKEILDCPDFDRDKALDMQINLLTLRKERLENLIDFARGIKKIGVNTMSFSVFDTKKIEDYEKQAKEAWGNSDAYKEFEKKQKNRKPEEMKQITVGLMNIFVEFGKMLSMDEASNEVQAQVEALKQYITEHYYTCTNQILSGLGQMYCAGGEMTDNIDKAGGKGTSAFVARAIELYVTK